MPVSDQGVTPVPEGGSNRYMLIPRTLVFLTRGEMVLLIKGSPYKRLWANLYNGVGGHLERGEDVLSGARRELAEETGLNPSSLWLCGTVVVDTGTSPGIGIFVLRGECPQGEAVASAEGSLEWVRASETPALPLVEDLYTLLPRVLAAKPSDVPFSGISRYDEEGRMELVFGGG